MDDIIWVTYRGRHIPIKPGMKAKFKKKELDKLKPLKKEKEPNLDYQGTSEVGGKAPTTGKTADTVINEVRKWESEGKNSVTIENNKDGIEALKQVEGNPDAKIKIYRATPGETINDGDWVFIDKQHAEGWTKTPMGTPKPGFKVVEMEVDAKNVEWTGKNLEFAYRKAGLQVEDTTPSIYTKEETHGFKYYTGGQALGLNAKLREGVALNEVETNVVKELDSGLQKAPVYKGYTYRTIDVADINDIKKQYAVGKLKEEPSYLSSNKKGLHYEDANVVYQIKSENGRINPVGLKGENEVLFARNSIYDVRDILEKDNKLYITMNEVPHLKTLTDYEQYFKENGYKPATAAKMAHEILNKRKGK